MQYYMLDKNDISVVRGIVSSKEVMRELCITNAQFHKMLRNEETYKGCKIIPFDIDLNKFTKEEYEDMIRDFLQSGLVVRCLPLKEDDF